MGSLQKVPASDIWKGGWYYKQITYNIQYFRGLDSSTLFFHTYGKRIWYIRHVFEIYYIISWLRKTNAFCINETIYYQILNNISNSWCLCSKIKNHAHMCSTVESSCQYSVFKQKSPSDKKHLMNHIWIFIHISSTLWL